MKKILCPRCQVINLEGFVTYPNCAGCGALLPGAEESANKGHDTWTRRGVALWLWASVLGMSLLGLGLMAAIAFQPAPAPSPGLLLVGSAPPAVRAGDVVTIHLQINVMDGGDKRAQAPLKDVYLRVPKTLFEGNGARKPPFAIEGTSPLADRVEEMGSGRYYMFHSVERNSEIALTLRALQPGQPDLRLRIRDKDQKTNDYRLRIRILPAQ